MQLSFWEKMIDAFRYNDALWHNIFLTIIYALFAFAACFAVGNFIRSAKRSENRDVTERRNSPRPWKTLYFTFGGAFGLLIIPLLIFIILSIVLGDASSARANNQIIVYEQDNHQVAVTVVKKFTATSQEYGITSGTTHSYLQAVDMKRGQTRWKIKLPDGSETKTILGETEANIIVFNGKGISIVDKSSGDVIADQKTFIKNSPALHGQFAPNQDWYIWDDHGQLLRFKGADGQLYELDLTEFTGKAVQNVEANNYLDQHAGQSLFDPGNNGLVLLAKSGLEDGRYITFLGQEEVQALSTQELESSSFSSERRQLYIGSLHQMGKLTTEDLKPVIDQFFIHGGFLADLESDASNPYAFASPPEFKSLVKEPAAPDPDQYRDRDTFYKDRDKYDKAREAYRDQEQKYNDLFNKLKNRGGYVTELAPLSTGQEGTFVVAHQDSTLPDAHLLLSAVDTVNGKLLWTMDTNMQYLGTHKVLDGSLVIMGMSRSMEITDILKISLSDGHLIGFNLKYERSYERSPS